MRESTVVNRQATWRSSVFVAWAHASSSVLRTPRSPMRRKAISSGKTIRFRLTRCQGRQFDFGDVEPGAMLGGMVDRESTGRSNAAAGANASCSAAMGISR